MEQLRQRITAACHISPMDADETREYVRHRLRHVGWAGRPHLELDAYESIFEVTEGVPRRINTLCDRLLLAGFLSEKLVLDGQDVKQAADEIRAETTLGAAPEPAAANESRAGPNGSDVLHGLGITADDLDALDLAIDDETAQRVTTMVSRLQAGDFEERLARLEKQSLSTLAVLRHLLNALRARRSSSVQKENEQ
jgi:hypothetical protein